MTDESHAGLSLTSVTEELLTKFGFDRTSFDALKSRLARGEATDAQNRITGKVEAPRTGDVVPLPPIGSGARIELENAGNAAIQRGEVAAVVLAGGMATRFGGVVKAAVEVAEGKTFLDLKLADIRAAALRGGGKIVTYLMTSFATDADVARMAAAQSSDAAPVRTFSQFISLRLDKDGSLFRTPSGAVSPYAPGHGDLSFALRASGALAQLAASGVKYVYMSNVDNLAATLDPAIIGAHVLSGKAISVEAANKAMGDKGGAPARVDGTLQVVEGFRFPDGFDQDSIPVFNTNSFVINLDAIDRDFPLSWFAVNKDVEGKKAVQFERLVGELTAFLPCNVIGVQREGEDGRFMPVKDPPELDTRRPAIVALLRQRGALG